MKPGALYRWLRRVNYGVESAIQTGYSLENGLSRLDSGFELAFPDESAARILLASTEAAFALHGRRRLGFSPVESQSFFWFGIVAAPWTWERIEHTGDWPSLH